ncbi:hypothetical protein SK355_02105 [Candidatus Fukatsuia symbiotica]|uniref:Uncharacterized protein n=1 Tax=Candidatus Fukatsuia symbiotica TaxID=1878942 RepID=A0A2Y9CKA2_9GAMM|nr:hypothetical protein [Candidatus Fukatsuia symbiotica]AWK13267.1 hypothetical protein CCS41_00175 [Candidatus Fukatsuia symbiotica]MEA9444137.1 hypothetical protein [Candidatus Fukatsuia symbiotica]
MNTGVQNFGQVLNIWKTRIGKELSPQEKKIAQAQATNTSFSPTQNITRVNPKALKKFQEKLDARLESFTSEPTKTDKYGRPVLPRHEMVIKSSISTAAAAKGRGLIANGVVTRIKEYLNTLTEQGRTPHAKSVAEAKQLAELANKHAKSADEHGVRAQNSSANIEIEKKRLVNEEAADKTMVDKYLTTKDNIQKYKNIITKSASNKKDAEKRLKTDSCLKALEGNMQEHRSKIIESASNTGNVEKILGKIGEHLEDLKNNIQKAEKERESATIFSEKVERIGEEVEKIRKETVSKRTFRSSPRYSRGE